MNTDNLSSSGKIARLVFYGTIMVGGLGGLISLANVYQPVTALLAVIASVLVSSFVLLVLACQEKFRAAVRRRPLFSVAGMTAALLANAIAFSSVMAYLVIFAVAACLYAADKVFGQAAVTVGKAATQ